MLFFEGYFFLFFIWNLLAKAVMLVFTSLVGVRKLFCWFLVKVLYRFCIWVVEVGVE